MSDTQSLGQRLRAIRKQRRMTLIDVSEATNLSVGFLSQVERDITRPSLDSLDLIVHALDATLSAILHKPDLPVAASRREGRVAHLIESGPFSYERLSTTFPSQMLNAVKLNVPPGVTSREFAYEGEQLAMVLSGSIRFVIERVMFELNPGDSLHFSTIQPHRMLNAGGVPAELIIVSTRPLFDEDGLLVIPRIKDAPPD